MGAERKVRIWGNRSCARNRFHRTGNWRQQPSSRAEGHDEIEGMFGQRCWHTETGTTQDGRLTTRPEVWNKKDYVEKLGVGALEKGF